MTVRDAAGAVRRGATQEALVVLWNEVESARLAGDRAALAQIEGLARRIAQAGDDAERREAERLLEATRAAAETESIGVAAPTGERDVSPVGADVQRRVEAEPADEPSRGALGPLVWFLIVLGIVILNLLGQLRD